MTGLDDFNRLAEDAATRALLGCCSSGRWADAVAAARPYQSIEALLTESDRAVSALGEADLRAALAGHPRIGDRTLVSGDRPGSATGRLGDSQPAADGRSAVLGVAQPAGTAGVLPDARAARPPPPSGLLPDARAARPLPPSGLLPDARAAQPLPPSGLLPDARAAHGAGWSAREQAGVSSADEATLRALAEGNAAYEERFGHIYLVCATGRSGAALLGFLRQRLGSDREPEWRVVAGELAKINQIRLRKLVAGLADRADSQ